MKTSNKISNKIDFGNNIWSTQPVNCKGFYTNQQPIQNKHNVLDIQQQCSRLLVSMLKPSYNYNSYGSNIATSRYSATNQICLKVIIHFLLFTTPSDFNDKMHLHVYNGYGQVPRTLGLFSSTFYHLETSEGSSGFTLFHRVVNCQLKGFN